MIVAGVDFGTLSVRVTLMETDTGATLGGAAASYPLKRSADDPLLGGQAHADHMDGLTRAMREALETAGIDGAQVAALACDTTGSSVVMLDKDLQPLADYYLWCDHRAHHEAAEITALARAEGLEAINWCGGTYSHEWGYAKVLHFLRHNPDLRPRFATAIEHCDMVAATLCGIREIADLPRSICGAGHKWMYGAAWGGLPPQDFLSRVDPLFDGINAKLAGRYLTSDNIAGHLSPEWAEKLGLKAGIPIPVGAFDAHWDAIGAGGQPGDVINVVGTSTCIIALGPEDFRPVPGLCGVVPGSVLPGWAGIEAGQSATGDVFEAIARRGNLDLATALDGYDDLIPGGTGLMRINWDNGDRTVLVRSDLGAVTLGWDLNHRAADELFAAIEGMAMHVRIIIERIASGGAECGRIVNAGGIPQKNALLNQIYADVLNRDVYVPQTSPTGTGSCIFAAVAAGAFPDFASAQAALCPAPRIYHPRAENRAGYDALFALFADLYFAMGEGRPADLGRILPALRQCRLAAAEARHTPSNQGQ
ncbi:ribulokinase [Xinfangfangia sp. D13-10-4-6]|uniref:ribulokinase n=1 Tax=Pseudogemmobacter hezensis TaxID=2737662 RepID=UPI00155802A6|nr:ribulokinase [Pseudogemmobacter hezensis]NPD14732.1 ribulokinase [Pseudogemmobacter hezensis]